MKKNSAFDRKKLSGIYRFFAKSIENRVQFAVFSQYGAFLPVCGRYYYGNGMYFLPADGNPAKNDIPQHIQGGISEKNFDSSKLVRQLPYRYDTRFSGTSKIFNKAGKKDDSKKGKFIRERSVR